MKKVNCVRSISNIPVFFIVSSINPYTQLRKSLCVLATKKSKGTAKPELQFLDTVKDGEGHAKCEPIIQNELASFFSNRLSGLDAWHVCFYLQKQFAFALISLSPSLTSDTRLCVAKQELLI